MSASSSVPTPPIPAPPPAPSPRKRFPWLIVAVAAAVLAAIIAVGAVVIGGDDAAGGDDPAGAVTVPDVQGEAATVAIANVTQAGLRPSPANVDGLPCDPLVASQNPAAGAAAEKGATVALTFAPCGSPLLAVPDVQGQPASTALARLQAGGFVTVPPDTSGVPCDPVVSSQRPAPGSPAAPGTIVTLTLPACPITVPSVQGQAATAAIATITAAGLTPAPRDVQGLPCDPEVASQDPAPGSAVDKGATVTLTLAACPTTAIVPDVVGDIESVAQAAVSGAGLRPITRSVVDRTCNDIGTVRSQTPAAGTEVPLGSMVTIVVATRPPTPCP